MGQVSTGITITFAAGFAAEILDVSLGGTSRKSIDTSHMGTTTAMTFTPGDLADRGEMTIELAFIPKTKPPINAAAGDTVITFADSSASVWTFTGFMTGFEFGAPLEERMTATATVKVSGTIVVS